MDISAKPLRFVVLAGQIIYPSLHDQPFRLPIWNRPLAAGMLSAAWR